MAKQADRRSRTHRRTPSDNDAKITFKPPATAARYCRFPRLGKDRSELPLVDLVCQEPWGVLQRASLSVGVSEELTAAFVELCVGPVLYS
ncbi:MAG: hypothetical protein ACI8Y4_004065 [Candidatus Poriferisodalaceae bacterium]|jgi:hypothetical protein